MIFVTVEPHRRPSRRTPLDAAPFHPRRLRPHAPDQHAAGAAKVGDGSPTSRGFTSVIDEPDLGGHPVQTCVNELACLTSAPADQRTAIVLRVRGRLSEMDDDCALVLERATHGPQGAWELPGHGVAEHGLMLCTFIADLDLDRCWLSAMAAEQLGQVAGPGSRQLRISDLRGRVALHDRHDWLQMLRTSAEHGGVHDHHHGLRTYGHGPRPAWTVVARAPASPGTGTRLLMGVLATTATA